MTHRITKVSGEYQMPITLEEAKAHSKVTIDAEDGVLRIYLEAAVDWCEEVTHRAIMRRNYLIVRDKFPRRAWTLPLGYIDSITSVQYLDSDGSAQTWGASNYTLDNASDTAAVLTPTPGGSWPGIGLYPASARVTAAAGWTAQNVPSSIKLAILQRFAQACDSRAPGDPESDAMEAATRAILAPWVLPIWA